MIITIKIQLGKKAIHYRNICDQLLPLLRKPETQKVVETSSTWRHPNKQTWKQI